VYDHTLTAFHSQRNSASDGAASSLLLTDKQRQTADLTELGVAMVPILAVARRGSYELLDAHLSGDEPSFFKPRHGSRSQGAFAAHVDRAGGLVVEPVVGRRLEGKDAATYWARLLSADDMIVQPRLGVDPGIADLASGDDIVTVRYISQWRPAAEGLESHVTCYCATIELPAGRRGEGGRPLYVVLPVDPLTGVIGRLPPSLLSAEQAGLYQSVYGRLGDRVVPGWMAICRQSHVAHGQFPALRAVAWDWAVTPAGPLLLEGNCNWDVATPQCLHGGLLAAQDRAGPGALRDRSGVDQGT
jgi:hypothetical protein